MFGKLWQDDTYEEAAPPPPVLTPYPVISSPVIPPGYRQTDTTWRGYAIVKPPESRLPAGYRADALMVARQLAAQYAQRAAALQEERRRQADLYRRNIQYLNQLRQQSKMAAATGDSASEKKIDAIAAKLEDQNMELARGAQDINYKARKNVEAAERIMGGQGRWSQGMIDEESTVESITGTSKDLFEPGWQLADAVAAWLKQAIVGPTSGVRRHQDSAWETPSSGIRRRR